MSNVKDLGKAVILALGLTGLGASVSSCIPLVAAGAGAYAGTKMAQKDPGRDMEIINHYASKVFYQDSGKEVCVCGGELYRNNSMGYYLLKGRRNGDCSILCDECIIGADKSRTFAFVAYQNLRFE